MDLSRSDDPGRKIYDMGPMAMKGWMIQRRTAIPTRGLKMYDMGPMAMKGRKMYDMGPVAMKGWLIQRRTAIPTREDTVAPGACSA